jgi:hypothetical protein
MKTSSIWNYRSIVSRIMMVLVLAVTLGSMDVAPALGKDHRDNKSYQKNQGKYHSGHYDYRGNRNGHYRYVNGRRVYYQSYGYRERVYVQPEVVYEPPPPPGISIFFPSIYIGP